MSFIPIKQEDDKFIVPAIKLENAKNSKKIPHPLGNDFIEFQTLEEAKKAINLAGFEYMSPDGKIQAGAGNSSVNVNYDKKILDALLKETKDFNPNIVATAISTLSEINSKTCLSVYIDKIGEENEKIRQNSIDAIIKYGLEALPEVLASLKSENWVKRNSAVICLQKFCELENAPVEDIINTLLEMLKDNSPIVKCSVIETLGKAYKNYKKQ